MKRYGYERKFALGCIAGSRLPRHADPAVGADDRVGRAHRAVDRHAVHRRHHPGLRGGDRLLAPTSCSSPSRSRTASARRARSRSAAGAAAVTSRAVDAAGRPRRCARSCSARCWSSSSSSACWAASGSACFTPTEGAGVGARCRPAARARQGRARQGDLRGHPVGRPHLRAAAAAAGVGPALQPRAVDDRHHRRGQGAVPRLRPRPVAGARASWC